MKNINIAMIVLALTLATTLFLSSCSHNYEQAIIGSEVQDTTKDDVLSATTTTLAKSPETQPSTTIIISPNSTTTTSRPQQQSPATTTSTTSTTTQPLTIQQQETLREKRYGYSFDLTTLNVQNCNSTLILIQQEKEKTLTDIRVSKEDRYKEQDKYNSLEAQLESYRQQNNQELINSYSKKVRDSQEKLDQIDDLINDKEKYIEELDDTLKKAKEECIKVNFYATQ